eukprot:5532857-Lingulodinium_polyedra.AAC.1
MTPATEHGRYGNEAGELLSRTWMGSQLAYRSTGVMPKWPLRHPHGLHEAGPTSHPPWCWRQRAP